jgi:type IV secretion system protein VirB4
MLSLKQYRDTKPGFVELLNYSSVVAPGVVRCKDGSLLAGFVFEGHDAQTLTNAERDLMSDYLNVALNRLGNGWATWVESVRLEAPGYSPRAHSAFPDPISELIDLERRAHFTRLSGQYETEHALFAQFLTPKVDRQNIGSIFVSGEDLSSGRSELEREIETFERGLQELQDTLSAGVRAIRRMKSIEYVDRAGKQQVQDEVVNFIQKAITGDYDVSLNLPPIPTYMDGWIAGQEFFPGDPPRIGENFIAVVSIEGFPSASFAGILDVLDDLALPYRWSTRMIYMDPHTSVQALTKTQNRWASVAIPLMSRIMRNDGGKINQDAANMAGQVEHAIQRANSAQVRYGYYTSVIVLTGPDPEELAERARMVANAINNEGFTTRVEKWNATEAWLGSLPGHVDPNVRRPMMATDNVADLLPVASAWPGLRKNPNDKFRFGYPAPPLMYTATTGATPFRLNLHVADVGHTIVFGPTGSGKSTLLTTISAQFFRYPNATIDFFDKGRSSYALCQAMGGSFYDLGSEHTPGLCPLEHLETDGDVAWAEDWLGICYALQNDGKQPTPDQKQNIHSALANMRSRPGQRSLTAFVNLCNDRHVKQSLAPYLITGPAGRMLDAEKGEVKDAKFRVYEIENLMDRGDQIVIPVLLTLFRQFERTLKGQPAMLVIDEAWVTLQHPVFRDKIADFLRTLRRANCSVILATQSLTDIADSPIGSVIDESCPTKIFLANPNAERYPAYTKFGLGPQAIRTIAQCVPKREYYYYSPLGQRRFSLELGPIALSFVGVSDREILPVIRDLVEEKGSEWPYEWLRRRGVAFEHLISSEK